MQGTSLLIITEFFHSLFSQNNVLGGYITNELLSICTKRIEKEMPNTEVAEFLEYDVEGSVLTLNFAVYEHDRDDTWNERRNPYTWVAVNLEDGAIEIDGDYT